MAGLMTMGVGGLVLLGWAYDIAALKSVLPGLVTMKANTAACFIFIGFALFMLRSSRSEAWQRGVTAIGSFVTAAIAGLTLVEYALKVNLGIDQFIFLEGGDALFTTDPGRMAVSTAVCFILAAVALWRGSKKSGIYAQQLISIAGFSIALVSLIGYLFGIKFIYFGISGFTAMAVHTAAVFALLFTGLFFIHYDQGLARAITERTSSGLLLRSFLPIIIMGFPLLGWLHTFLQLHESLSQDVSGCMVAFLEIAIVGGVFLWLVAFIRRVDMERQGVEDVLHKNQVLLDETGRIARIGGWEFDVARQRLLWTKEVFLIHEVDPGFEPTVSKAIDFYSEDSKPVIALAVQRALDNGEPFDLELEVITAKGSHLWVHAIGKVEQEDGKTKRVLGIFQDITERKRIESLLEKRMVALTRPLDHPEGIVFEELFDLSAIQRLQDEFSAAMGVASLITKVDGTPITRPSNFYRLCSHIIRCTEKGLHNCYRSDAFIGRYHPSGPVIQPCLSGGLWDAGASITIGDRHVANWLIGQVRDENQSEDKMRAYAREIGADEAAVVDAFREVPAMSFERFKRIAQVLYTLANQLSSMAYQNVQQARFITERKEVEELLKKAKADAEAASKAKSEFLNNIAHDFRTPMHSILGFSDLLKAEPLTEKQKKFASIIHERGRGLLGLVEDLLSVSRLESGKLELRSAAFDLEQCILSAIDVARIELLDKSVKMVVQIDGFIPRVIGDESRFNQILSNLIGNAVKYTDKGEILVKLSTNKDAKGKCRVRVSVKDTGFGISKEQQSKIFEAFTRFHEFEGGKERSGVGLGMYITQRLVDLMQGEIGVASEVGVGSEFVVTVPFDVIEPAAGPAEH